MTDVDRRPDPKPRRHPHLWQRYLVWDELMQQRKRHKLRLSSIEAGKSNLDAELELSIIEDLDGRVKIAREDMIGEGELVGPIWDWFVGIRGIGEHTAAKLLAQFDDVGKFATVSKFWRFSGWAVVDGKIDRCEKGKVSPYNRRLKSECYIVGENFVRQQTPVYVDIYYAEKERQRRLHPDVLCRTCLEDTGEVVKWDDCAWQSTHKRMFNDGHIDRRAKRKMIKIFLQHLWVKWREFEGLPVSEPYVQAVLGHEHIVRA